MKERRIPCIIKESVPWWTVFRASEEKMAGRGQGRMSFVIGFFSLIPAKKKKFVVGIDEKFIGLKNLENGDHAQI